jgi:hypothetical protein
MRHEEPPNSASTKDQAERDAAKADPNKPKAGVKEFRSDPKVDGKNDSGPEPEVHNREIPPQP